MNNNPTHRNMFFVLSLLFSLLSIHDLSCKTFKSSSYIVLPGAYEKCQTASGLIYVQTQDKVLISKAFGYADYLHKIKFTPDTQIHIGSLKKQFIAAAILRLVNEKKINLYAPITMYIQFNTSLAARHPEWIHTTTIHHLLTHVSGVLDYMGVPINKESPEPYLDRIYINATPPGLPLKFEYSSAAYRLLEIIIQKISKKSIDQYIVQHFLTPLNMTHTFFHGPTIPTLLRKSQSKNLCYPYYVDPKTNEISSTYDPNELWHFAQHDMVSTAKDLCKWSAALHSGKIFNTSKKRAEKLLQLMRGLYVLAEDGNSNYGYGIKIHIRNGETIYWHEGLVTGASVYLEYSPHTDTHVVVLSNNGGLWFDSKTGAYILKAINSKSEILLDKVTNLGINIPTPTASTENTVMTNIQP